MFFRKPSHLLLIMFLVPVILTYVMAYAPWWLPDTSSARLYVNIAADCMFIASLFVRGGDFWDKLAALFLYESRVQFEGEANQEIPQYSPSSKSS
jgi:hypothetical protein